MLIFFLEVAYLVSEATELVQVGLLLLVWELFGCFSVLYFLDLELVLKEFDFLL